MLVTARKLDALDESKVINTPLLVDQQPKQLTATELDLPSDDPRVNPNGGAIAVGHPLGASGARLALTALRQLERIQGRYALVSMCIGVGQGIAVVIERVNAG